MEPNRFQRWGMWLCLQFPCHPWIFPFSNHCLTSLTCRCIHTSPGFRPNRLLSLLLFLEREECMSLFLDSEVAGPKFPSSFNSCLYLGTLVLFISKIFAILLFSWAASPFIYLFCMNSQNPNHGITSLQQHFQSPHVMLQTVVMALKYNHLII